MKYYFENSESENSYPKEHFIELMEERGISKMRVLLAKIVRGEGYFFCQKYGEVGEMGESCGRLCGKYEPRNGKNGRCRFHAARYEPTDISVILKGKERVVYQNTCKECGQVFETTESDFKLCPTCYV